MTCRKKIDTNECNTVAQAGAGFELPAISLGLWHNFGKDQPFETARAICRRAFDLGITHFDLANNYGPPPGSAEEAFGKILATDFVDYRDQLIISSKAGYRMWPGPYGEWGSRKYLLASLDQSPRHRSWEVPVPRRPLFRLRSLSPQVQPRRG